MKKKKVSIVKIGLYFLVFTLLLTGLRLMLNKQQDKNLSTDKTISVTPTAAVSKDPTLHWDTFTSEDYNFSIKHPRLLYKQEFENEGGYVYFVQFLETQYTESKGLKIGISNNDLADEIERTKELMAEEGGGVSSETDILVDMNRAKKLEFNPREGLKDGLRPVVIVVIYDGNYSYSISSVPEQIDMLISTFNFINQEQGEGGSSFCGGIAGLPCPEGFTCKLADSYPDSGGVCVKK